MSDTFSDDRYDAGQEPNPLLITSVRFGLTKNQGNYESARLEAEAMVGDSNSPEEILEQLKSWVSSRLGRSPKLESVEAKLKAVQAEMDTYSDKIYAIQQNYQLGLRRFNELKSKYDEAKSVLERHGIEVADTFPTNPDETPF